MFGQNIDTGTLTSPTETELTLCFNKAKVDLMTKKNSTFICTILFNLKIEWNDAIGTAATDGISLFISPAWFTSLDENERFTLLAHEAWHVAFDHMSRGKKYNPTKFNFAADYVINGMLDNHRYTLPEGGLLDHQYDGMSTEQVYALLPDPPKDFTGGDIIDIIPENATDKQKKEIEIHVKKLLTQALQQAQISGQDPGTIPGDIRRHIEELINPKLDWFSILMNYMTAYDKSDYTFRKPNRRYLPDFYLPGMSGESMDTLALAFDSSGSVSQKEFNHYFGETKYMRELLRPKKTILIEFDTKIQSTYELEQDDDMDDVTFSGGGGTSLSPVFNYFKDNPPTVLIIFSDLWCPKITEDPGYDVIWICVNNKKGKVNFGELIHYDLKYDE